ncbi:MAG: hypothetical protein RJQ01_03800 [Microcella sp.]|uniref:hypothetical protein n=1 Tax=Microcella sp. TaxID=1913979 RepID=UPI003314FC9E
MNARRAPSAGAATCVVAAAGDVQVADQEGFVIAELAADVRTPANELTIVIAGRGKCRFGKRQDTTERNDGYEHNN